MKRSPIVDIAAQNGKRWLHEITMLDPAGYLMPVVTQTSLDVHPTESDYGRDIVREKRASGWLFWDRCPAGTGAVVDNDPCPPGTAMPCPHLLRHRECRVKDRAARTLISAQKAMSGVEKTLASQEASRADGALALSEAERRHNETLAQNQALMVQLAAAMQAIADSASNSKPARKPKGSGSE